MTYSLTKAALILALAGTLGACTDAGRFGKNGRDDAAAGGGDVSTAAIDPALNPTSPAYFSQTVGDRVLFPIDQSSLSSDGRAVLDGQASWLATNTAYAAIIEGHADEQGTREYNLALGARRANAVQEYLISKGVAGDRLRTVSYGKERPIEVCSDELCYSKNRRAVTVLSAGAGS